MRGNGPHPQPPLSRTVSCWAVGGEFGGRSPHQSARSIGRGWRGAFRCGRCSPLAARRLSWTAGQEQMVRARGEGRGGGGHCQPKAGAWVRRSWAMMGDAGARRSWAVMGRGGGGVGRAVTRPGINPRADPTKPLRGWTRAPGPVPLGWRKAVVVVGHAPRCRVCSTDSGGARSMEATSRRRQRACQRRPRANARTVRESPLPPSRGHPPDARERGARARSTGGGPTNQDDLVRVTDCAESGRAASHAHQP